jgi:hypothetical protein
MLPPAPGPSAAGPALKVVDPKHHVLRINRADAMAVDRRHQVAVAI